MSAQVCVCIRQVKQGSLPRDEHAFNVADIWTGLQTNFTI